MSFPSTGSSRCCAYAFRPGRAEASQVLLHPRGRGCESQLHSLAPEFDGPRNHSFNPCDYRVNVTPNCPKCGARSVPGAAFCQSCGSSLVLVPPQPFAVNELLLGDIPMAFSWELGFGPVRIVITDQRVLVLWIGPHQFFPSTRIYKEWKASLPALSRTRELSGTWVAPAEPPAWEFDISAIVSVHVGKVHALPSDPDMCALAITATADGIRSTAIGGMQFRHGVEKVIEWRVPGPASPIEDFLRRMPVAQFVR